MTEKYVLIDSFGDVIYDNDNLSEVQNYKAYWEEEIAEYGHPTQIYIRLEIKE